MKNNIYNHIKYRAPYGLPNIKYYDIYTIINKESSFENKIDKRIKKLKKRGIDINLYSEYFESLIEEYIANLFSVLKQMHTKNLNEIKNTFARRAGGKKELEELIETLKEQIIVTKSDLEFVKKLYDESNPLPKILLSSQKKNKEEVTANEETFEY